MTALPPPTDEVKGLVNVIGPEAALALIEAHGGTRIYVPKQPTPRIVRLIGDAAAAALCAALGGELRKIPVARAWRILVYHARGHRYPAIARKVGCDESTVWRVLSGAGRTNAQLDLFAAE